MLPFFSSEYIFKTLINNSVLKVLNNGVFEILFLQHTHSKTVPEFPARGMFDFVISSSPLVDRSLKKQKGRIILA